MSKQHGYAAEQFVANHLEKEGFVLLAKNYVSRYGEIDIVAHKDETLLFIEVKQRTKKYFDLSELVTTSKQKRIIATAKYFLLNNDYSDKICRFDVALLEGALPDPKLTYIPNAFTEQDWYI
ncbi:MAG: YraN family protein [Candidatus Dependentiae bacterium]|nr:YraN family protein [Candidatus Dependentiae bacterium]